MKIWFAASIPENSFGGVQRSMKHLSEYLKSKGHKVNIIYCPVQLKNNYLLFSLFLALKFLISFWNRPEWIIARSTDGLFSALLAKVFSFNTRFALHNHGWEEKSFQIESRLPLKTISNPTSWKSYLVRFPLLQLTLKISDICICGTIEEARWISKRYKSSQNKMRIIPNGVHSSSKPFWPSQNNLPFSFLIIGGFTWKKNIEYGIEVFRNLSAIISDARLFLVGTGKLPSSKMQLINSLGDSVFIVENEFPDKMNRWYETCPFTLSTSRYEGGRAFNILESQAYGSIVFATPIPSTCELLSDFHNGIFLSGNDPVADSKKIVKVCFDNDLIKSIGINAWKTAKRNSLQRQGQRLSNVLKIE